MPNISGQILSELGEVVKQTGTEAAKVPVDVAGSALESLGSGTATPVRSNSTGNNESLQGVEKEASPLQTYRSSSDRVKRTIARKALEYIAGQDTRAAESGVRERHEAFLQEKREQEAKQAAVSAQMAPVSAPRGKRRGDLFGLKGKQSSEVSRNVRQD